MQCKVPFSNKLNFYLAHVSYYKFVKIYCNDVTVELLGSVISIKFNKQYEYTNNLVKLFIIEKEATLER